MSATPLDAARAEARTAEAAGRPDLAYDALLESLTLAPRPHAGTEAMLAFLRRYAPRRRNAGVDAVWRQALDEAWARPSELALPVAAYLATDPHIATALAEAPISAGLAAALDADALLHALLRSTPVPDPAWERLLGGLARWALSEPSALGCPTLLESLAIWAWLSERLALPPADPEPARVLLRGLAAGDVPSPAGLARAAIAAPLFPVEWQPHLTRLPDSELRRCLLAEPLRDAELEQGWSAAATDDTALAAQYEAAPYPRWRREPRGLPVVSPAPVARRLAAIGSPAPEVLIAGCGSGQQLFVAADRYPAGTRLSALDLSRRSLAYARRQCEDAGLPVADWHCGDLRSLAARPARFDVVECVGVLHHLEDPAEGWRALAAAAKPGGLLLAAVYSARARKPITALRERLRAEDSDISPAELHRELLAGRHGEPDPAIVRSIDFYSASGCRDLLLNVRERVYRLEDFVAEAKAAGFDWLCLEAPSAVAAAARQQSGTAPERLRPAQWEAFEAKQPRAFGGMFQVWFVRR